MQGSGASRHLLAFNWRDPGHPEAGGAEVHLHELLRRFVAAGHRVTQLSTGFPGGAAECTLDGVRILRRGRWFDGNWSLRRAYLRELAGTPFDLVVEDINKIPFFTPTFVRAPVLAVVPHLFGATVFREAAWPVAAYVYAHELLLPRVYRRTDFMVISESTRDDLVARGFDPSQIRVVSVGVDHQLYRPDPAVPKAAAPLIVYLGRLRRYKGVQDLVRAFAVLCGAHPGARLVIVGDGPYRPALARLAARVPGVELAGFVPPEEKLRLLRSAWMTVYPSAKEGFGLTVIESNACGTPVVATRVPGLQDAVREGESGMLVPHGDVAALAGAIERLIGDAALRKTLIEGGLIWAREFQWDRAATEALAAVEWAIDRAATAAGRLPTAGSREAVR